ncbi:4-(cytidine 5'-diphospho)-2-C-methyl-D-erythritol kinase [Caenimonas aquaedulcis]|uniref:4-diphosphocytidyl-2-C-methyl-D-erythritol kinase n=1 Tax=Caenimonas aquaedulcis TaxID=2793270 RepID=A0A931H6I0_9BURK|nr:4-(cytidine 5'-diphospho)-2-C-methyl-D-erythritol kinase [Caenimonas aquaedulcis]MBG9389560.1 4-(cytidine 5'-diphospho)-2-C-methyl-D-erythritol kinase [Caenimonas aquaedulcis]
MKAIYDVPAPAKLNLFLHVTGRRDDGMHLLQSVFMLIDWCDTLHFEVRPDATVSREDLGRPLPPDDLVLRAARALQVASGTRLGAHIGIDKRLPEQAGMGGGSSDAASCLLALNRLWGAGLSLPALATIGLTLGADVPFFLGGYNAWVEGIGESLTPVRLPPGRFAVVKPPQGLPTAGIFGHPRLTRDSEPAIISGFAANPGPDAWNDIWKFGRNDLQGVAQELCPGVTQALDWLGSQGLSGRMTGSGSAVFAHLGAGKSLKAAPEGWLARECGNLEAHPLAGWAPSDDISVGG